MDGRGPADLRPVTASGGRSSRPRTVPGCSSGVRPRCSTSPPSACPAWTSCSTPSGSTTKKRYMHHYNMPPYANGEVGRVGSPKRREIGHGLLAERALLPVVPSIEEFPYALRLVSDVLSSNGSTSMASVCGSTLSLMDAGVPIKAPVAGIAMGLVHVDGQVHHPHRHPRCRGRLRRHGLQGGGHVGVRHRPAAGHQDRRSARRRARRGPAAGPRGPARRSSGSCTTAIAEPRLDGARHGARRSSASRSRSTRSARSSGPRARSSTPCRRRPVPTSRSTTTGRSAP